MRPQRALIVNADDLGLSHGVTDGILRAHAEGIVTSASLMVRPPTARDAVARSGSFPDLSLGLHIDLGEWIYRDETWVPLYEVVPLHDGDAVSSEVRRQLETFRALVGRDPTHLDSHQHVHAREPVRSTVIRLGEELAVPVRHVTPWIRYCGRFYGQTTEGMPLPASISVQALRGILGELERGTTELACHPGFAGDLTTMYRSEREAEVRVLCDPLVREILSEQEIVLRSFAAESAVEGGT